MAPALSLPLLQRLLLLLVVGTVLSGGLSGCNALTSLAQVFGSSPAVLYSPLGGMTQQQARSRYLHGLQALNRGESAEALKDFEALQAVYPGLGDWIRLHLAQAAQAMGREDKVQEALKTLLQSYPASPLRGQAHYRLGQSHFRASEPEAARRQFEQALGSDRQSDWAVGSLYYLGQLLGKEQPAQKRTYWQQYVTQVPDGTFALEVARYLDQADTGTQWTPALHAAVGKAYLISQDADSLKLALGHLEKASLGASWHDRVEAYSRAKQWDKAIATLQSALKSSVSDQKAREVLDKLLPLLPAARQNDLLMPLGNHPVATAQDYIWWQLARLHPEQAAGYYERIVTQTADSDYAPESNWLLLFPLLKNRNIVIFMDKAQAHVARYPFSRSAPKALFWLGKVSEAQRRNEAAISFYKRLMREYPMDYYAFRAYGRLEELDYGQSDPQWDLVSAAASDYPAGQPVLSALTSGLWQSATLPEKFHRDAKELATIGASQDLLGLYEALHLTPPPALQAWHEQAAGQRDVSMRTLRDAIQSARTLPASVPVSHWRLLYPLHFSEAINAQASRHDLDPFIVQALMREESYFNELAVSGSDARGLMQLLPSTAADVAKWESLTAFNAMQLFVPDTNIQLGTRYLAYLLKFQQGSAMAMVGSYNGGPNAMKKWRDQFLAEQQQPDWDWFVESIQYPETQQYIKKVFGSYWAYNRLYAPARFDHLPPLGATAS